MIAVLVGDQDSVQVFRGPADRGEPMPDLAETEARIDQNASLGGFQVGAITS